MKNLKNLSNLTCQKNMLGAAPPTPRVVRRELCALRSRAAMLREVLGDFIFLLLLPKLYKIKISHPLDPKNEIEKCL